MTDDPSNRNVFNTMSTLDLVSLIQLQNIVCIQFEKIRVQSIHSLHCTQHASEPKQQMFETQTSSPCDHMKASNSQTFQNFRVTFTKVLSLHGFDQTHKNSNQHCFILHIGQWDDRQFCTFLIKLWEMSGFYGWIEIGKGSFSNLVGKTPFSAFWSEKLPFSENWALWGKRPFLPCGV